jgi:hypothetical protein
MKKLFICLANSRKYSGRCIAGIELQYGDDMRLRIVRNAENNPKWIRPVSENEYGELNNDWVRHIRLGDLIEMEAKDHNGFRHYQIENVPFVHNTVKVVEHLELHQDRLNMLRTFDRLPLFGCYQNAIHLDKVGDTERSLQFIRVTNVQLGWREEAGKRPQERLIFTYNDAQYNLPLTDIEFVEKYLQDNTILHNAKTIYLTVSLSLPYEGKIFKLAAGVFWV